jgi:hypothetical protein
MKVEHIKLPPLDYDPYDECCCGSHVQEKVVITEGEETPIPMILELVYFQSGIGGSIQITAKTEDGQVGKIAVWAFVDDDGKLNFYAENRTAK